TGFPPILPTKNRDSASRQIPVTIPPGSQYHRTGLTPRRCDESWPGFGHRVAAVGAATILIWSIHDGRSLSALAVARFGCMSLDRHAENLFRSLELACSFCRQPAIHATNGPGICLAVHPARLVP